MISVAIARHFEILVKVDHEIVCFVLIQGQKSLIVKRWIAFVDKIDDQLRKDPANAIVRLGEIAKMNPRQINLKICNPHVNWETRALQCCV